MSNQGDVDDDQECNMNLKPDTVQNCDMGACARSWFTSLWSQRVTVGVRMRACVHECQCKLGEEDWDFAININIQIKATLCGNIPSDNIGAAYHTKVHV